MTKTKTVAKTDSEFDASELVALAQFDIDQGRLDRALAKLKQAMGLEDFPTIAYAIAARLYGQLGLYDRAKGLFEQYLTAVPDAVLESFQLGMTYYDAGELDQALAIWEKLLARKPVHPPALFYKSLVLAYGGQSADAMQTLDVLMKSAPADNLYFGRAKELRQAIENGVRPTLSGQPRADTAAVPPREAYQTEH